MENTGIESREVLISTFGNEIGRKLFGAAVKISADYGIDVDDFCQDLAIEAVAVEEKYGFIHIKTVVREAKIKAFRYSGRYGVSEYYGSQFVELLYDDMGNTTNDDDGNDALETLTLDSDSRIEESLSDTFAETVASLSDTDKLVLTALGEGWKASEIAKEIGKSPAYITLAKKRLETAFAWAVA